MRNIFIILLFFLFKANLLFAQINLVPNPSFEYYTSCPTSDGQIDRAYPWVDPTVSSDYFNQCDNSNKVGVPINMDGVEFAHTGVAYAGFLTFSYKYPNMREYIETVLSDSLIKNKRYCISFYVSLAEISDYATNDIGIYFSIEAINDPVDPYNPMSLPYSPQIINPDINLLTSKNGWTKVSGSFIANGGEKYITVGVFSDSVNIDTVFVGGGGDLPWYISYYYIDDVSVTLYEDTAETEEGNIFIPTAFTPNNDGQNDILYVRGGLKNMEIKIFNQWGLKVFETNEQSRGWNGIYKGEKQPTANYVYMFKGITTQGKEITKNGVVSLIR